MPAVVHGPSFVGANGDNAGQVLWYEATNLAYRSVQKYGLQPFFLFYMLINGRLGSS